MKKCICAGCIIIDNGKVLLIRHKRLNAWLYPGGHVEANEVPVETAIRETKEETGLDVEIIGLFDGKQIDTELAKESSKPLLILYETVPYRSEPHMHFDMVYLARAKSGRLAISEDESTEAGWFEEREIDSLETFDNAKQALHRAFETYKHVS